jgi:hypothetical protein
VIDTANKEPIPDALHSEILSLLAGGDEARARVIYIKLRLRQEFPMTLQEALNPVVLSASGLPSLYKTTLTGMGITAPPATRQPYESAACLLLALQRTRGGMSFSPDSVDVNSVQAEPTTGLKYYVDGWGTPFAFYRWALNSDIDQLNKAQPPDPAAKFRDSQDREGALMNPTWWSTTSPVNYRQNFVSLLHPLPGAQTDPPRSAFLTPIIVSAGPDKRLGYDIWKNGVPDPMTSGSTDPNVAKMGNPSETNDNLFSYRLRPGGRGN